MGFPAFGDVGAVGLKRAGEREDDLVLGARFKWRHGLASLPAPGSECPLRVTQPGS